MPIGLPADLAPRGRNYAQIHTCWESVECTFSKYPYGVLGSHLLADWSGGRLSKSEISLSLTRALTWRRMRRSLGRARVPLLSLDHKLGPTLLEAHACKHQIAEAVSWSVPGEIQDGTGDAPGGC